MAQQSQRPSPRRRRRQAGTARTASRAQRPSHVVIVGPDGQPVAAVPASALQHRARAPGTPKDAEDDLTSLVEQPAKVMRIGSMIRQLLEEVKSAPLDDASRQRLKEIHRRSIKELETGLAPELVEELERLTLPFTGEETPSDAELRISQAQLVGWLEGLFHGIQTAIYAQQMAARAQFEQIRRALPPGVTDRHRAARPGRSARPAGAGGRRAGARFGRHVPLSADARFVCATPVSGVSHRAIRRRIGVRASGVSGRARRRPSGRAGRSAPWRRRGRPAGSAAAVRRRPPG